MKQIKTADDSITFLDDSIGESFNPVLGSIKFAKELYINPSNLKDNTKLLEIGSGLGYCTSLAIQKALQQHCTLDIICLESNAEIIKKIQELKVPQELAQAYEYIKKASSSGYYKDNSISITIIQGDARKTIKEIKEKFNLIFLDGFSVTKSPELYSVEFLKLLKERINQDGLLITHSSSPVIRAGLREAGFKISQGEVLERIKTTHASLSGQPELSEEDKRLISAFGKPFHDPNLNWGKEKILEEWKTTFRF